MRRRGKAGEEGDEGCPVWRVKPEARHSSEFMAGFGETHGPSEVRGFCPWVRVANTNRGGWWSLTSRSSTSSVSLQLILLLMSLVLCYPRVWVNLFTFFNHQTIRKTYSLKNSVLLKCWYLLSVFIYILNVISIRDRKNNHYTKLKILPTAYSASKLLWFLSHQMMKEINIDLFKCRINVFGTFK